MILLQHIPERTAQRRHSPIRYQCQHVDENGSRDISEEDRLRTLQGSRCQLAWQRATHHQAHCCNNVWWVPIGIMKLRRMPAPFHWLKKAMVLVSQLSELSLCGTGS